MNIVNQLQERAAQCLVGGVSSGWNAFPITGPIYFKKADSVYLYDADGNQYIDYVVGWGSLILGHNPPAIREAFMQALETGFGFQYETEYHIELAETICSVVPCAEQVRLANSGTEATMHALRVARQKTGKNKVIKFEGHFHGLNDYLLYATDTSPKLGAFLQDREIEPIPGSAGIPHVLDELVITLPYNDVEAFVSAIRRHRHELAAVIMEPIALDMGCVSPDKEFLEVVRKETAKEGIILIFDEVLTGFRVRLGGAQEYYGVIPDLVCLGKALGGGMPIAALAGKKEIMEVLAPLGSVQMSGTNTGRFMTVVGTLAVLRELMRPGFYAHLDTLNRAFIDGFASLLERYAIPGYIDGFGGRIGIYFGSNERPRSLRDIIKSWNKAFHMQCYRQAALEKKLYGFLLPLPICPEAVTLCAAHTLEDINETLNRVEDIFKSVPYSNQQG